MHHFKFLLFYLMKGKLSRRGFTLVELLIVMAILAVLIGISVAGIGYALRQSRNIARQAAMANLDRALEAYYSDKLEYPSPVNFTMEQLIYGNAAAVPPVEFLAPYLEGTWEAPPQSHFTYRVETNGYYYIVCSRMELTRGAMYWLCSGPGIGQTGWPQTERQDAAVNCDTPGVCSNICGIVGDTNHLTPCT